jgi:hypothetical protein
MVASTPRLAVCDPCECRPPDCPPVPQSPAVILSAIYVCLLRLIQLALLSRRSDHAKDIEIVVLRQQLAVLRRHTPRPAYRPADRVFLANASRFLRRPHQYLAAAADRRTHHTGGSAVWHPRRVPGRHPRKHPATDRHRHGDVLAHLQRYHDPGRGPALARAHTYDANDAATDGPLGFGWTFTYNMSLSIDAGQAKRSRLSAF